MNSSHSLCLALLLLSMMLSANSQCNNCTTGTFCYSQDNSDSTYTMDTSPTTYCASCMSNCANCSSFSTCNTCETGYFYYTQQNSPSAYVDSSSPTVSCTACISDCNSCSSLTTCDECVSGYSFNGSYCASISNLAVGPQLGMTPGQFNMMWVFGIVGGVIGIGLMVTISYYCLDRKRRRNVKAYEEQSVKEDMINQVGNHQLTVYGESFNKQQMAKQTQVSSIQRQ